MNIDKIYKPLDAIMDMCFEPRVRDLEKKYKELLVYLYSIEVNDYVWHDGVIKEILERHTGLAWEELNEQ